MNSFKLTIVCPDGCLYDGPAEFIKLRTTGGDVGILAHHIQYAAAIGMGECEVQIGETRRKAACIGGMLTMMDGECHLLATTWEWADAIDKNRAEEAKKKAEEILARDNLSDKEIRLAEAKLHRALVRIGVKE